MKKYTIEEAKNLLRGRHWDTGNLEDKTKGAKETNASIVKSLQSIGNFFNEAIENAPNEHVTDNSMRFLVGIDNKPPPTVFKFSPPYKFEP